MITIDPGVKAAVLRSQLEKAVQSSMEEIAIAKGYDSLATAISYAEEPAVPRFQVDGQAFRAWRSKVWQYAYEQLTAVETGARAAMPIETLLAEIPALEIPNVEG